MQMFIYTALGILFAMRLVGVIISDSLVDEIISDCKFAFLSLAAEHIGQEQMTQQGSSFPRFLLFYKSLMAALNFLIINTMHITPLPLYS